MTIAVYAVVLCGRKSDVLSSEGKENNNDPTLQRGGNTQKYCSKNNPDDAKERKRMYEPEESVYPVDNVNLRHRGSQEAWAQMIRKSRHVHAC